MTRHFSSAVFVLGLLTVVDAAAQSSPVGLWKSIDDNSGKPMALIRISDSNGEFRGKIEKLFAPPADDANPKCTKCDDARKDQPIIGMTIIEGMHADGASYAGGTILDPDNGKVYKSRMTLADEGSKLKVRGYIGVPMFGRTQTWLRQQ